MSARRTLKIDCTQQLMTLWEDNRCVQDYSVSTGANGCGELKNSGKTPRGLHRIRAKIGNNMPINTVFVARRPTGESYHPELKKQFPERDWILTRILWLSGCEIGKNRLSDVDTMQRYIYIHGTPDETLLGQIGSRGCIRMSNRDIISVFDWVSIGTFVEIIGD